MLKAIDGLKDLLLVAHFTKFALLSGMFLGENKDKQVNLSVRTAGKMIMGLCSCVLSLPYMLSRQFTGHDPDLRGG